VAGVLFPSNSGGFASVLCAPGGVAADLGLMAAKPELVGALIEAKPEVVGGGRVSYVEDVCRDVGCAGGVFCDGIEPGWGGLGPGDAGRPFTPYADRSGGPSIGGCPVWVLGGGGGGTVLYVGPPW
jgi:hypothetical protein